VCQTQRLLTCTVPIPPQDTPLYLDITLFARRLNQEQTLPLAQLADFGDVECPISPNDAERLWSRLIAHGLSRFNSKKEFIVNDTRMAGKPFAVLLFSLCRRFPVFKQFVDGCATHSSSTLRDDIDNEARHRLRCAAVTQPDDRLLREAVDASLLCFLKTEVLFSAKRIAARFCVAAQAALSNARATSASGTIVGLVRDSLDEEQFRAAAPDSLFASHRVVAASPQFRRYGRPTQLDCVSDAILAELVHFRPRFVHGAWATVIANIARLWEAVGASRVTLLDQTVHASRTAAVAQLQRQCEIAALVLTSSNDMMPFVDMHGSGMRTRTTEYRRQTHEMLAKAYADYMRRFVRWSRIDIAREHCGERVARGGVQVTALGVALMARYRVPRGRDGAHFLLPAALRVYAVNAALHAVELRKVSESAHTNIKPSVQRDTASANTSFVVWDPAGGCAFHWCEHTYEYRPVCVVPDDEHGLLVSDADVVGSV